MNISWNGHRNRFFKASGRLHKKQADNTYFSANASISFLSEKWIHGIKRPCFVCQSFKKNQRE